MTEPSNFRDAIGPNVVVCPHCGEQGPTADRPISLLQKELSGRWFCNICSTVFWPVKLDA